MLCVCVFVQNLGLQAENEGLRSENEREKLRQQQIIGDFENKMKQLQHQLMSNVNNFLTARDAQATLRTEIDTYRTLLDQGQRRCVALNTRPYTWWWRTPSLDYIW